MIRLNTRSNAASPPPAPPVPSVRVGADQRDQSHDLRRLLVAICAAPLPRNLKLLCLILALEPRDGPGLTINALAHRAGMSRATVYRTLCDSRDQLGEVEAAGVDSATGEKCYRLSAWAIDNLLHHTGGVA